MPTCSNGHEVVAGKFCPTCGVPIANTADTLAPEALPPTDPGWTVPQPVQPPPVRNTTVWIVAAAGVVVVAVVAGVLLFGRNQNIAATTGAAATTTATDVPAPTISADTIVPPEPTTPTTAASPTPLIDTSAVDSDPLSAAVAPTFQTYFTGINSKDFASAYAVLSPANHTRLTFTKFKSGSATSTDSAISLQSLQPSSGGSVIAVVGFTSHQAPNNGPRPGEGCTVWSLSYRMVPATTGAGYRIDSVTPTGGGSQPC